MEALTARLQGTGSGRLYCPRAATTKGVVPCTSEQCFKPYSPRTRYCHGQLPVSSRRLQIFLQFRLGCHGLSIAAGRLAGAGQGHMHALAPLRQQHANLRHTSYSESDSWGFALIQSFETYVIDYPNLIKNFNMTLWYTV